MTPRRALGTVIVAAIAASAVRLLNVVLLQPLNWDEVEFFRATDWVRQGLVPYRDFWEHHTPLQWFVFAPFVTLTNSVDGHAIVFLRLAQVPLWIATFALMAIWMRDDGIDRFARWAAMAIALSSSFLMIAAVEYRVDVLGCTLYAAGLVLMQRMRTRPRLAFGAGAMFALAGLANLRLGPLLVLSVLAAAFLAPRAAGWLAGGIVAVFGAFVGYCVATHSLGDLVQHVWYDNLFGDRYATVVPFRFIHRLLLSFGFRIISNGMSHFDVATVDLGGIAILILGAAGTVMTFRTRKLRDDRFVLALLALANLLFIAKMKLVYNYHFEIVVVMLLPFIALAIERLGRERLVVGIVVLCAVTSSAAAFFRGKEDDRRYQDFVMREVDRRTLPGDRVFDGVGWALRRGPAYRYWFLPELVRQLEPRKVVEPYDAPQAMREPPAAFIADLNALYYLRGHPRLKSFLLAHYLPRWHELWLPGLSARLTAEGPAAEWVVPADGRYRIYASPRLAGHPWFLGGGQAEVALPAMPLVEGASLAWSVNGVARDAAGGLLLLRKHERLRVVATTAQPLGMFIVPGDDLLLFRQPPPGVSLDSLALRVTHVPRL